MSQREVAAMEMITISQGTEIAGAKQSIRYTFHIKASRTRGGRTKEDMRDNTGLKITYQKAEFHIHAAEATSELEHIIQDLTKAQK